MAPPQLHLSAVQRRLETPERWRLVALVVALALITILQVAYFHIKFEAAVRMSPGAPVVFSQRLDESLDANGPSHSQNVLPQILETSITSQQDPLAIDLQKKNRPTTPPPPTSNTTTTNTSRAARPTHASAVLLDLRAQNRTSSMESRTKDHQTTIETPSTFQSKREDEPTLQLDRHHNISNAALTYNGSSTPRFDILAFNHSPDPQFPPDFDNLRDVVNILQNISFDLSTLRPLNFTLRTDMLGILIDAGRHYFQVWWLKRLIDILAVLQFNLIHFRLTDDQAFAIQLESQPNLTWPARFRGKMKRAFTA